MKALRYALLLSWFVSEFALACSPAATRLQYVQRNHQLLYVKVDYDYQNNSSKPKLIESTLNTIEGVRFSDFHRVDTSNSNQGWDDGLSFNAMFDYFTDNQRVFWSGRELVNPVGVAPVDAGSFVQPFDNLSFAVDNTNIYYEGKRVGSNTGAQKVDLKTLRVLDEYLLADANNLYRFGRYVGRSDGFKIKRWMPNRVLDYSDKTGAHTYSYGHTPSQLQEQLTSELKYAHGFVLARDKVFYTQNPNQYSGTQHLIEIPNVDPETFVVLNPKVATDGKNLYELKGDMNGEQALSLNVVVLDQSIKEVKEVTAPYTIGGSHIYFINDAGVQEFVLQGSYVKLSDDFARDDQYIYIVDDQGRAATRRFKTANAQLARVLSQYTDSDLATVEGVYNRHGEFSATR